MLIDYLNKQILFHFLKYWRQGIVIVLGLTCLNGRGLWLTHFVEILQYRLWRTTTVELQFYLTTVPVFHNVLRSLYVSWILDHLGAHNRNIKSGFAVWVS